MVYEGAEPITSLMVGTMGVKTVAVGNDVVYQRPGGYVYIQLISDKGE